MDDDDAPVQQHHQHLQQLLRLQQEQQRQLIHLRHEQQQEIERLQKQQEENDRAVGKLPLIELLQQLIEEAARVANDPIHPRLRCIESLVRYEQFPTRQRRKIDQLIGTYHANLKIQQEGRRRQEPQELIQELIQIQQQQERKKDGVVLTSPLLGLLQQLIVDAARVATDRDDPIHSRLLCIESLLRGEQFSGQPRWKITGFAKEFITNLKADIHDMNTDQRNGEDYDGLDRERDTIEEVQSILQLFPDLLQKRKTTTWGTVLTYNVDIDEDEVHRAWVDTENDDEGDYPIQCLVYVRDNKGNPYLNIKAVPFIHLFAQLALEYNTFDIEQRGGLVIEMESLTI